MIRQLRLERFKGFKDATLELEPFTIIVGANATGKSNLRDAFRFLIAVARAHPLATVFGKTWSDSGQEVWSGIRGGIAGVAHNASDTFRLTVSLEALRWGSNFVGPATFQIAVDVSNGGPRIAAESLEIGDSPVYQVVGGGPTDPDAAKRSFLEVRYRDCPGPSIEAETLWFRADTPVLGHFLSAGEPPAPDVPLDMESLMANIGPLVVELMFTRFLEPVAERLREPSVPGVGSLGDSGGNLSSVLRSMCDDEAQKARLVSWMRRLTPMDAVDLEFVPFPNGELMLAIVEPNGQKTLAYNASDGTLRFLAYLALFLGPHPPKLVFLEEIENGIHPSRINLLLDLFREVTASGETQVIATTHSSALLQWLKPEEFKNIALTYRAEDEDFARIRRPVDIPDAVRVMTEHNRAELHATGWMENVAEFADAKEADDRR